MGLGGIIAGALGGGAQAVGQMAQQQLDYNDKQSMAAYTSQLEMDRQAAAARLQQQLGQQTKVDDLTGDVAKARQAAAGPEALAQAQAKSQPGVLAAEAAVEDNKVRELAPGGQALRGKNVVSENTRPTAGDAYAAGTKGSGAGASKIPWTQKEIDDGLTTVTNLAKDAFKDATGVTPGPLVSAVSSAYMNAVRRGASPPEAREEALAAGTEVSKHVEDLKRENPKMTDAQAFQQVRQDLVAEAKKKKAEQDELTRLANTPVPEAYQEEGRKSRGQDLAPPEPPAVIGAAMAGSDLTKKSWLDLKTMIESPRTTDAGRAAAQAERKRRDALAPPNASSDPSYSRSGFSK